MSRTSEVLPKAEDIWNLNTPPRPAKPGDKPGDKAPDKSARAGDRPAGKTESKIESKAETRSESKPAAGSDGERGEDDAAAKP